MKVIFLDRDGVISRSPRSRSGYATTWKEFSFFPGSKTAIKKLTKAGFTIMVISNQGGVSKGIFTKKALSIITKRMLKEIKKAGGKIRSVHYCIHTDEDNCDCRKPKTGLFKKATRGLKIDFNKTFFIGDTMRDVLAGQAIGCKTILVLSGRTKLKDRKNWEARPDYVAKTLLEAVERIVLKGSRI